MKNSSSYLAHQELIDHSKKPLNYGLHKSYDFLSGQLNPSCGDSIVISGIASRGVILDVRFEGKGCILSMAMASKLSEDVKGMSFDDVLKLSKDDVSRLLGIKLGINRMQCGMLSVLAIQKAVRNYLHSKKTD